MKHLNALGAAALLSVGAPLLANAETTLIYNSFLPPYDEMYQVAVKDFAARIEAESQGDIHIQIPDSSLAPSDRQYEMVRDGIADMAIVSSGAVPQLVTLNRIADLPFSAPTAEAGAVALWETYEKYFEPMNEFKGVKVLSTHVLPGRQMLSTSDREITDVPSLSGFKLWSPPGTLTKTAEALGAVPVNSEFTDLQEYVTKGTVDGVILTPGSADGARILENVKSYTKIPGGLGSLSFAVFISQESWEGLTADQQGAILRAADGLPGRTGAAADAAEAELSEIVAQIPTTEVSGAALASFEDVLNAQIDLWKEKAAAKGLENPDEVYDFYRARLDHALAAN
ncbi:TRAP transporter substrate-binding protein DctP [Donghicola mangrovi]|uniref:TRAP transporter substrate-binding protein DctP n=1 Tax=Donghicola mangrovi TaxID=2729614 RepID=A0A850QF39_9RHOB|nr:TRAP transporter substrate-binding protein DctP [Donghicola mangrovi]NVO25558.1 TRAP transporter substrate-binding protein DctP [Donghicola mangrovi]